MAVTVELPPGCSGLNAKDGTRYTAARPGGRIQVDERHADAIRKSEYGEHGLIDARGLAFLGTKQGRECPQCRWRWQNWTHVCPRCEVATVPLAG